MGNLFYERLKLYFKDDYDLALKKLDEKAKTSIFLNTCKADVNTIKEMIDFDVEDSLINPNSLFYECESIGKTKAYDLGLVYPQELSASLPMMIPDITSVKIAVDMCASPGGKSINLLNRLSDDAILISNEIDYKRAQVLTSNLERLGFGNVIITNKETKKLLNLEGKVDLVVLDAPCSGEGMVKKYPEIIQDYSMSNIELCAKRQKELLETAYSLLKNGGTMVYSTCTLAFEEDEDQIKDFLLNHSDMELIDFSIGGKHYDGMAKFTVLDDMEGQFMAYMKKGGSCDKVNYQYKKVVSEKVVEDFIKENLNLDHYYLYNQKEHYYLSLNPLIDMHENVLRYGIYLGDVVKKRFEPSHHLFRANGLKGKFNNYYDLNDEQYDSYLKGLEIMTDLSSGYYLLTYHGLSFAFSKCVNGTLKNKYPKGLRRMV